MTDTPGAPEPDAPEPGAPDRWPPPPDPGSAATQPAPAWDPWTRAPAPGPPEARPAGPRHAAPASGSYPASSAVPPAAWPPPAAPEPGYRAAPEYGTAPQPGYGTSAAPGYGTAPQPGYGTPAAPGYGTTPEPGYGTAPMPGAGYGTEPVPGGFATSPVPWSATGPAGAPPRRRGAGRWLAIIVVAVLGLAGVGGGGLALTRELGRAPTHAEVQAALRQEIAGRWQHLPAGKIFPATIGYRTAQNVKSTARLVGIGRPVSCAAGFGPTALAKVGTGCRTLLRATYVDASGTLLLTAGVAVMPSPQAASEAMSRLSAAHAGGRPLAFSGTIAGRFHAAQRARAGAQAAGPYLLVFAAGYADGEPGHAARGNEELAALGLGVLDQVGVVLSAHGSPCTMKDISC